MSSNDIPWLSAPQDVELQTDDLHLWHADLSLSVDTLSLLASALSPDETNRAERFVFDKDRRSFIAARGILRNILGLYVKSEPQDIVFSYNDFGKPSLADNTNDDDLRFNMSHSYGQALYALTVARNIGVDLELIRSNVDYEGLTKRFFSPTEASVLLSLPPHSRKEAFFKCWTRKEAYIKALGKGLSMALDSFDVSMSPGEDARLTGHADDPEELERWSLIDLDPHPRYAGAIAVEGKDVNLKLFRWRVDNM